MTPELEFVTMTAFDRIEISKGEIDGIIERHDNGRFYLWLDMPPHMDDGGTDHSALIDGTPLSAMTELVRMMDAALTAQDDPS